MSTPETPNLRIRIPPDNIEYIIMLRKFDRHMMDQTKQVSIASVGTGISCCILWYKTGIPMLYTTALVFFGISGIFSFITYRLVKKINTFEWV